MSSRLRASLPIILALLLVPIAHGQSYHEELNLGAAAYKNSHYEEAIQHFRKATELDPSQMVAHMYLATAYASEYIPGVDSPDNMQVAEQAIEQYGMVFNSDAPGSTKLNAAKGMAYLYLNMKKWQEARDCYQKASGFDANDPEPYYSIAVTDWTQPYQPRMEARSQLNLRPEEHLDSSIPAQKKLCEDLRSKNSALIEDGITNLKEAIRLRPDYDDAMAYLNLMYRERADLECDDPVARERDLKRADDWVDKTLAVKKAKAEKSNGQSSTVPNPQ